MFYNITIWYLIFKPNPSYKLILTKKLTRIFRVYLFNCTSNYISKKKKSLQAQLSPTYFFFYIICVFNYLKVKTRPFSTRWKKKSFPHLFFHFSCNFLVGDRNKYFFLTKNITTNTSISFAYNLGSICGHLKKKIIVNQYI